MTLLDKMKVSGLDPAVYWLCKNRPKKKALVESILSYFDAWKTINGPLTMLPVIKSLLTTHDMQVETLKGALEEIFPLSPYLCQSSVKIQQLVTYLNAFPEIATLTLTHVASEQANMPTINQYNVRLADSAGGASHVSHGSSLDAWCKGGGGEHNGTSWYGAEEHDTDSDSDHSYSSYNTQAPSEAGSHHPLRFDDPMADEHQQPPWVMAARQTASMEVEHSAGGRNAAHNVARNVDAAEASSVDPIQMLQDR
jgi:hypothetical protein